MDLIDLINGYPLEQLRAAFGARAAAAGGGANRWILKPSEGAKGEVRLHDVHA